MSTDCLADFFPWKGCHPEDNLARECVREGFYNKSKFPFNLSQSRLAGDNAAYSPGSHNLGSHENVSPARFFYRSLHREPPMISSLSAVFTAVLEMRQSQGKMSSGSSFKPPPRVTLTEAKRKSWLNDLANPTVPLRRLSRTIPQGIRGQSLLEQCLVNGIPIGRAIWFAKCVGANEIRTLKRKGTSASFAASAETKWLREWTSSIEALIESTLFNCGTPEWRIRTNYCIELGTRFYDENLLDREHYLDWIVKTILKSNFDRLPIWMLFVHIHTKDLGRFRRRGRLLVEALLDKLRTALDDDAEVFKPVIEKICSFIKSFVRAYPACFLLPRSWNRHCGTLWYCLDSDIKIDRSLFDELEARNARISISDPTGSKQPTPPRQTLIKSLDSLKFPCDLSTVSSLCLKAGKDSTGLVSDLLQWSTTRFRTGLHRQYLAVRLLRKWNKEGLDIETPIYATISGTALVPHMQMEAIYRIISELVRSKTFSMSRYLQWLTARGAGARFDSPELQLLINLPARCLPEHVRNLRDAMMSRAGISVTAEMETVHHAKADLARALPVIFGGLETASPKLLDLIHRLRGLNGSARFEISYWARANVAEHYHEPVAKLDEEQEHPDICKLTLPEFELLRGVLELFSDMPILADLIYDASNSDDDGVLAAAVDTLNHHHATFSVLGAFDELHHLLFEAYHRLRTTGPSARNLTVSLIDLASQKPSSITSVKSLRSDLARGEKNAAIAACSPISDHMAETLHSAGGSFNDEFEQLLSTGNSMDDQTLASLFRAITARLESGTADKKTTPEVLCQMLCRLKAFRLKQFDSLMGKWLERLLQNTNQSTMKRLFLPLIALNCTNFHTIFIIGKDLLSADAARPGIVNANIVRSSLCKVVDIWCHDSELSVPSLQYRFQLLQDKYADEYPAEALEILHMTARPGSDVLVESLLLRGLGPCNSDSGRWLTSSPAAFLLPALDNLLQRSEIEDTVPYALTIPKLRHAIGNHNDFSSPLLQLYIEFGLQDPALREALLDILFESARSQAQCNPSINGEIFSLLSTLSPEASQKILEKAEQCFFAMAPPYTPASVALSTHEKAQNCFQAANYLSIIDATAHNLSNHIRERDISIGPIFVEKLSGFLKYLASQSQSAPATLNAQNDSLSPAITVFLTQLLELISLHRDSLSPEVPTTPSTTNAPSKIDQSPLKILLALISIALHPILNAATAASKTANLISHILDTTALLVDTLSPDCLSLVTRLLKDRAKDPRAKFLLGNMNSSASSVSSFESEEGASGPTTFLAVKPDGSGTTSSKVLGEWRVKPWELLEGGAEPSLGLGLFAAKKSKM